jgi:hypothetical protein
LDHLFFAGLIDVAYKLHGNVAAILRFQRQVFIANIAILLQSLQHGLVGNNILEGTQIANSLPDHFFPRKSQQPNQIGIYVGDAPRFHLQNQNAILRRFKQTAIA